MTRRSVSESASQLALVSLGLAIYAAIVRPRQLRWGATAEEARRPLPGDHLVPACDTQTTRAITILKSPSRIWPWIVQIGYGRGGFYSYDRLERLAGLADLHSVGRVVPEWQTLRKGEAVSISPVTPMTVEVLEPGKALALHAVMNLFTAQVVDQLSTGPGLFLDWSWAFVLEAYTPFITRLVVRVRARFSSPWLGKPLAWGLIEPAHFLMERKMLLGIKARAEAAPR